MKSFKDKQRGFTLLEILITVLIMSIGLLGLAGLQVTSLKNNHSSYQRTQVTLLAYDIVDRMRSNPTAIATGNYVAKGSYTVTASGSTHTISAPAATAGCTTTAGCTVSAMASTDINQWRVLLADKLPGGEGVICLDATPDDGTSAGSHSCDNAGTVYAVKIWWNDDKNAAGTLKRFVVRYVP